MQLVQIWECSLMIDKEYMSPCSNMCTEIMKLLWRASGKAPQRAVADNVSRNAGAPHARAFWRGAQAACDAGAPDNAGAVAAAPDALPRTAAALSSAPCWQTSPSRRVWFCGVPWAWGERGCRQLQAGDVVTARDESPAVAPDAEVLLHRTTAQSTIVRRRFENLLISCA